MAPFAYADASALVKLFLAESEATDLRRFLREVSELVSASIVRVEVHRALRRAAASEPIVAAARRTLAQIHLRRPSEALLDRAETLDPDSLRTLDALHVATALDFSPRPDYFLCYDPRLAAAARHHGLRVVAPGLDAARER